MVCILSHYLGLWSFDLHTQHPVKSIGLPLMLCKTCHNAILSFIYAAISFASTLCLPHPGDLSNPWQSAYMQLVLTDAATCL